MLHSNYNLLGCAMTYSTVLHLKAHANAKIDATKHRIQPRESGGFAIIPSAPSEDGPCLLDSSSLLFKERVSSPPNHRDRPS